MIRPYAAALCLLVAAACSETVEPDPPADFGGTVEVSVATTGESFDEDGYSLRVGEESRSIEVQADEVFEDVPPGTPEIALEDVADNCFVQGENPRTVKIQPGTFLTAAIDVECVPPLADRLFFVTYRQAPGELWSMMVDGSNQAPLPGDDVLGVAPAISLAAGAVAFAKNGRIFTMNLDGTGLRQVTTGGILDRWPTWSPDGTRLAYSSVRDGNWDIYVVDADGSNQVRVTTDPQTDIVPDWSPDGERIVFTSTRGDNYNLYTIAPDGTGLASLTATSEWEIGSVWSPDGSRIAYTRTPSGGSDHDVFVMDADGANATRLTSSPGTDLWPAWSPDGSEIAFMSERDGNAEIYIMNADGSNLRRLTDDPADDTEPAWAR